MRIILNGQQAFGKAALEAILKEGKDEVVAVYTAPDKEGRPPDPVKQAALEHKLPLFQPASYKDEAVLAELRSHQADLMVMAYVIIFIPEAARSIPKHGSICFHPSLLPLFPGLDTHARALAAGMAVHGCTVHEVTTELDSGPILGQAVVPVAEGDTPETLAARVLPMEHRLYPAVLRRFAAGDRRKVALFP